MSRADYCGDALRAKLDLAGLSIRGLAGKVNRSHQAVRKWLGGRLPAEELEAALARALEPPPVLPPATRVRAQVPGYCSVEAAVADTFYCEPLRARLTRRQCVIRQTMELFDASHQHSNHWTKTLQNERCQSGLCDVGALHLVQLGAGPRLTTARVRKTPMAGLGGLHPPPGLSATEGRPTRTPEV